MKELIVIVSVVISFTTSFVLMGAKLDTLLGSDAEQDVSIESGEVVDITQNLAIQATKSDISAIKDSLERVGEDVEDIRDEISDLRDDIREDIGGLRNDIRSAYLKPLPSVATKSEQNGASRIETL
jgi:peptidoglycan hydrolase CwlO-like protein